MRTIVIPKPINGHGHLRQDPIFTYLVALAIHLFCHYFGMGNTKPPILNTKDAKRYKGGALGVLTQEEMRLERNIDFEMHPVIKLREDTPPQTVFEAIKAGFRFFKLYPKSKTTHADDGITNYLCRNLVKCYEIIANERTPRGERAHTLWHAEHPGKLWDDSECEYGFFGTFESVHNLIPDLLMTWCHLSDSRLIPHLIEMGERVAIELAVHYAFIRENDTHGKNHNVCRPPAKRWRDMEAIRKLMVSGLPRIINGLDDAPHPLENKECADASCGVFSLPVALPLIIQVFEEENVLDQIGGQTKLENFLVENAARFYNLSVSAEQITLKNESWVVPPSYHFGKTTVVPFMANQTLPWQVVQT